LQPYFFCVKKQRKNSYLADIKGEKIARQVKIVCEDMKPPCNTPGSGVLTAASRARQGLSEGGRNGFHSISQPLIYKWGLVEISMSSQRRLGGAGHIGPPSPLHHLIKQIVPIEC
jgi:hypothetical protein